MPKPFDATTKYLIELRPADWLAYLGLPPAAVEVIDADLATVTASADKVLHVREPQPWLLHLEPQAGYERDLGTGAKRRRGCWSTACCCGAGTTCRSGPSSCCCARPRMART